MEYIPNQKEYIPYQKGKPPPGDNYILVRVIDEETGKDEGLQWVPREQIGDAPIRHEQINSLLPMLRWTWRHLEKYVHWCRTFEDWELGFMRDTNPGSEVAIWVMATYAFLEFTHDERWEKAGVFKAVRKVLIGRDDLVRPKRVARRLKKLMSKPPQFLKDVENFTADGHLKTGERYLR